MDDRMTDDRKQRDLIDFMAEQPAPPAPASASATPEKLPSEAPPPTPSRRLVAGDPPAWKRLATTGVMVVALAGVGILGWLATGSGKHVMDPASLPMIKAEIAPFKTEPKDPGGMAIPDQDKTVFNTISSQPGGHQEVIDVSKEKVVPPPEEPVSRDKITQLATPVPAPTAPVTAPAPQGEAGNAPAREAEPSAAADADKKAAALADPAEAKASPEPVDIADFAPSAEGVVKPETPATPEAAAVPPKKPTIKIIKVTPSEVASSKQKKAAKKDKAGTAKPNGKVKNSTEESSVRLQLGSFKTEASLLVVWEQLRKDFPVELGKLGHSIEIADVEGKGTFYRLYTASLSDQETAQSICDKLKAKNRGCFLAK